jgi:polyhydroxyalkanoate synthesis regulator phasin
MKEENQNIVRNGERWLRVGLLTYTLAAPFISAFLEQLRRRSQTAQNQAQTLQESGRAAQTTTLTRLDELTSETRQLVNEQVQQLQKQAKQLEAVTRQLRKAARRQAKQSRKYYAQVRKAGDVWTQDLAERGSQARQDLLGRGSKVTSDLVERGGKATQGVVAATQDLLERSSKATQELAERGNQVTQDVVERSNEVTRQLARRGKQLTQELAERGDQLLAPVRKQQAQLTGTRRNAWAISGFSLGVVIAAIATYFFVRQRMARLQQEDLEQQIELPQSGSLDGTSSPTRSKPAGEIRHVNDIGTAVATMPVVDVEEMQRPPEDAILVGIVSTRLYYPVETPLDAKDLVYFVSEEEAKEQGFTAATQ